MAPSFTLQYCIRPSQPSRSLPLKNSFVASSARAVEMPAPAANTPARPRQSNILRTFDFPLDNRAPGEPAPGAHAWNTQKLAGLAFAQLDSDLIHVGHTLGQLRHRERRLVFDG